MSVHRAVDVFQKPARSAPDPQAGPRRLVILGATGSIGSSAADVIANAPAGRFEVEAVAAGRDAAGLAVVARRLGARFAAVADEAALPALREALAGTGIETAAGPDAIIEAAMRQADIVVAAITGAAGVAPTHAAVRAGRIVALANKECLVCAGEPFMREVVRHHAALLPMDSEHNAIFQALGGFSTTGVEKMILTASGGPFRTWSRERIAAATPEQALAHPNWSMGAKISVDSATMMNKGLELIEARHLFAIDPDKLDVLVHPQSVVHGLVSFADGSAIAGLSNPDMRTHIAQCLAWPERIPTRARSLDLAAIGGLTFEAADLGRFPALGLAREAMRAGGGAPTALNAANEIAVEAFLSRRIGCADIARLVEQTCEECSGAGELKAPQTIEDALGVDHIARERVRAILANSSGRGMVTNQ